MCCKSTIICEHIKSDQALFILGSEYKELFVYIPFHSVHSFPEIHPFQKSTCQNTHIHNNCMHTCIKKSWATKTPYGKEFGAAGHELGVSVKTQALGQGRFFLSELKRQSRGGQPWNQSSCLTAEGEKKVSLAKMEKAGFFPTGPN